VARCGMNHERDCRRYGLLMKSSWHVATAAEAIAAAQFARLGLDVSVQYGANQPEYDLIVADGDRMLKVSVKGSRDGGWGLSQAQLTALRKANPDAPTDYHRAADNWLRRHKPRTAVCFVQFKDVGIDVLPRIYLAWPQEVCDRLKSARRGKGDTVLWERGLHGLRASVPDHWKLTEKRVSELMAN
jgi:Holliday junction resolvase-like predicted endonuclease